MSKGETSGGGSRRTNQNNSVNPDTDGNSTVSSESPELPTPDERLSEFYDEFPELASLRLAEGHGVTLRKEYTWTEWESWSSEGPREQDDDVSGDSVLERGAVSWSEAIKRTLESHAESRKTKINLECGVPSDPEYAEFSIDAETRWFASYQKRYFAQMKAWLRELIGGERPSGGVSEPEYDDPYIALITLSASSIPNGERVGPVEHDRVRRSSWSGSGGCYDTLRNQMRRLGYDWQYDRRSEPHTGKRGSKGINRCYGHDHVILVVDGEVKPSDLRPVVEKHVEECEWAGPAAHDLDVTDWDANREDVNTVSIREPNELDDVAAYLADYCAIEPTDLLERDIQYVAWAAAVNAANTKTISRSDAAKWASTADSCKQRYESERSDQSVNHGESVLRSSRRGVKIECACCGSPHGIDQDQTLTAARSSGSSVAADGGVDRAGDLMDKWPSARAVATVGDTQKRTKLRKRLERYRDINSLENTDLYRPKHLARFNEDPEQLRDLIDEMVTEVDRSEPVGAKRPPEWRVTSVTVGDEEYPASSGNGVELVETVDPIDQIISHSRLDQDGADSTYWRCELNDVCVWGARAAAAQLYKQGVTHPRVIDDSITAVRGKLA